jgi:tetratricopeptide (TPR) repeat protein
LLERAIELGWGGRPDPRSDVAEFHLRAGRREETAAIWAELKGMDPDDVWLYDAAGLSYNEIGEHELAIAWLGQGIELAMRTDDPEGIIDQLSDVRRSSLEALDRDLDELEQRVGSFMAEWSSEEHSRERRLARLYEAGNLSLPAPARDDDDEEVFMSLAWFPSGEYARMDGNIKWMRSQGMPIRAVAPIVIEEFLAWCAEHDEDPEEARAAYAAHCMRDGDAISWPPGRNQPCWCGSGRRYKKCCGPVPARPTHDAQR